MGASGAVIAGMRLRFAERGSRRARKAPQRIPQQVYLKMHLAAYGAGQLRSGDGFRTGITRWDLNERRGPTEIPRRGTNERMRAPEKDRKTKKSNRSTNHVLMLLSHCTDMRVCHDLLEKLPKRSQNSPENDEVQWDQWERAQKRSLARSSILAEVQLASLGPTHCALTRSPGLRPSGDPSGPSDKSGDPREHGLLLLLL